MTPFLSRASFLAPLTALLLASSPVAHADRASDRTAQKAADDTRYATATIELYKQFTYRHQTHRGADSLFSSVGIPSTFNPREKMKNPDPTWIPGWNSLGRAPDTKSAILQAAVNRTWMVEAMKEYTTYQSAWVAIEKQLRSRFTAALGGTSFYDKAAELAAIFTEARAMATAANVLYEGSPLGTIGILDEIVQAMVTTHRDAKVEFLLPQYLVQAKVDLAAFQKSGRPAADEATERDFFLAHLEQVGTRATPALPLMMSRDATVKWPTKDPTAARKAATARIEAARAAHVPTIVTPNVPSLFRGGSGDPADPKLVSVDPPVATKSQLEGLSPLLVTKIDKKGDAMHVVLVATERRREKTGACRRVVAMSGAIITSCDDREVTSTITLDVTFSLLPTGVEIKKGDQLAFYADLEARKNAKTASSYTLTSRALVRVTRAGKVIWSIDPAQTAGK